MKEITDIVQNFDSRINLSNHSLYDVFGLENGESVLKKLFYECSKNGLSRFIRNYRIQAFD